MKQNYIVIFVLPFLLFATTGLIGQFVTPVTAITGQSEVTTVDGKTYNGKLRNEVSGPMGIMSFKLRDATGTDTKFKANEVKQLKIKVDDLAKVEIIADQSESISKLANSNFKEVVDRKFIYWQRVKNPDKEKYYLLQLLNPGFDDIIKVYDLPDAKSGETSVDDVVVSGGDAKAYYVVKGSKTYKITKKKYKKQDFNLLFGDCQQIIDNNEPDFKNFAEHVFFYNERCK